MKDQIFLSPSSIKPILFFFFTISLIANLGGCKTADTPTIKPERITSGSLVGNGVSQQDMMISSQSEWTNFLHDFNDRFQSNGNDKITQQTIDFSENQILVIFDAWKNSRDHIIIFDKLIDSNEKIVLHFNHVPPQIESGETILTQPYFILKVPRLSKPLAIEHFATPPNIFADQVLKGALNDNTLIDKENFVIDNQDEWNNLLEKMSNNSSINFLEFSTSVDFNNYLALASFDKFDCSYPSCSTITNDITVIQESEAAITITVQNLLTIATEGYPQPFHIVKIPKSEKRVEFQRL
ncbi:MAG: hypothetical protein BroJett042_20180 [Bacteroidota bacterium]|nr:MAG: hypothetical protein BroJett042_20180 [Bacteroidota bacterium]